MKKLLFNGCSYTAGDELVWDTYCKEELGYVVKWSNWNGAGKNVDYTIYNGYKVYRKQFNLGGQCALLCGTETIELAEDGYSNAGIAITTINYLLSLTPDERKNIHVCIGWTVAERRLVWKNDDTGFINVHHQHIELPGREDLYSFIRGAIIDRSDFDHLLDYVSQVMLLENFLKANGITYTFWRSLGIITEPIKTFNLTLSINDKISNNENWIKFNDDYKLVINGNAWSHYMDIDNFISEKNKHPNLKTVTDFSTKIADHILSHSN